MTELFPWQQVNWQHLLHAQQQRRLGHAQLIISPQANGGFSFCQTLAQYLLCLQPSSGAACGVCASCRQFAQQVHPDYCLIGGGDQSTIKIDAVRAIDDFVINKPQLAQLRVCLISPLDKLTVAAANALLKNLEEPPGETIFICQADVAGSLLPTIRSRCQMQRLAAPNLSQTLDYLASQQLADINQYSQAQWQLLWRCAARQVFRLVDWLNNQQVSIWLELGQLLITKQFINPEQAVKLSQQWSERLNFTQLLDAWQMCLISRCAVSQKQLERQRLFQFYQTLITVKKNSQQVSALNPAMAYQHLLHHYCQCN